MHRRVLPLVLFVLLGLAALLFTPLAVSFVKRPAFACEFDAGFEYWLFSLTNIRHIAAYGLLTVVAVWAFGTRRLWLAAGLTLLVTVGVEVTQGIFAEGHCRLRDMLPNLVAVGLGIGVALLLARLLRRSASRA